MKTAAIIQHSSAEYLGLIEDHLEGRGIRFRYFRPFTSDGKLPDEAAIADGLVLLGGGPWGCAGENDLPTLKAEIELARLALERAIPLLGIGLGAQILALAAGGRVHDAALRMGVHTAQRVQADALSGLVPENFPVATYLRDRLELPAGADVIASLHDDDPAIWRAAPKAIGFAGHPGLKPGMVEDLIMEFEQTPDDVAVGLSELGAVKVGIADALVPLMTGLVREFDWM